MPEPLAAIERPERCHAGYGASTSIISTLGVTGVQATMFIEGSVDTLVFNAYCQEIPRLTLKAGDVIVLDNPGAHRASRVEEMAGSCGARVIWLPPYSPDFSPIELMWSKVKHLFETNQSQNAG
ncbi:MAG TPA: transposase [Pyrinomonadaceae bacterium]|nr:transposase [Pyrinomonadaceae bacterium]